MVLDPTTLWFYRAALAGVGLLCLVGSILLLAKAGSVQNRTGLAGWVAWWLQDGKSYVMSIAASGATAAYAFELLSFERWTVAMGLINGTAIATLRAAQGKATKAANSATAAAEEAAGLAATTQNTVKAAVRAPITPVSVPLPTPPAPSPVVILTPGLTRVPRERDLPGGTP